MQEHWVNSDHDTLIEIRTLVSELKHDISQLREGTHIQLIEHDKRIRTLEDQSTRNQPDEKIKKYDKVADEWNDFRTRLKVYIVLSSFFAGLIATALTTLLRIYLER
jgi:hypothetical protein